MAKVDKNKFISLVTYEEGQLVITLPEELLKALDLHHNQVLEWEIVSDTKVILTKSKLIKEQ